MVGCVGGHEFGECRRLLMIKSGDNEETSVLTSVLMIEHGPMGLTVGLEVAHMGKTLIFCLQN